MRRERRLMVSIILAWATTAAPPVADGLGCAFAQSGGKATKSTAPPAALADNKQLARAGYEKGRAAEAAGNLQEAFAEYRAALALHPDLQVEAALGQAALKLGKHREAAQALRHVLNDPTAKKLLSPDALAEIQKNMTATLEKVGMLQLDGPPGAEVWVDGTFLGTLPMKEEPFVDAGERDVEARRGGAVLARARANVTAGKSEAVKLVEGEIFSPAPTTSAVAPPPAPSVTATATGAATSTGAAPVPTATFTPVGGGPPPDKGAPSWAGVLALGGVAVAAAAVGTGLWIVSDGKAAEARQKFDALPPLPPGACTTAACQEVHDTLSAQASLQAGAAVAWGIGGAALLGAGVLWLVTGKAPQRGGTRIMPSIGSSAGSFLVEASW